MKLLNTLFSEIINEKKCIKCKTNLICMFSSNQMCIHCETYHTKHKTKANSVSIIQRREKASKMANSKVPFNNALYYSNSVVYPKNFSKLTNKNNEEETDINFSCFVDPSTYKKPGLSEKKIESLNRIMSSICLNNDKNDSNNIDLFKTCTICKEECSTDNWIKLDCSHFFHENCIIPWLKDNNSCPICRFTI
jgi:hypothetical protein